ncbi:MAG: Bax inhibitor-1/YccA family protein [Candidatus Hydrogenedentes bacterium]|nr:Bax inhibitor-1/YccA family protein [Candidatus Hydrogenedentota bacterium]
MSYDQNVFRPEEYTLADQASRDERAAFITKTYVHLFAAILAFVVLEAVVLSLPITASFVGWIAGTQFGWLAVLGGFMAVSWIANSWAQSGASLGLQYAGLSLYVVAEAIIFAPLLYIAANFGPAGVIPSAAILTGCVFTGLTSIVFFTRKNFSFLGPFLGILGFAGLGIIVCSIIFGFNLGIVFSAAMIVLAGGYILYTTSNILHEYRTDQYVAASLALFASVALLFWYILRILMSFSRE